MRGAGVFLEKVRYTTLIPPGPFSLIEKGSKSFWKPLALTRMRRGLG
jgi:hypothetical protein